VENPSVSSDNFGKVPLEGIFSITRWAEFFETSEQSIRRWRKKYNIPYFQPGDTMFIDARDFIRRIPYHEQDEPLEE
jgi:hypothetical protein